jgi:hypothetical protein
MKLQASTIKNNLGRAAAVARRYALPIFLVFLLGVYSFLAWRVMTLNQVEPDQSIVAAKLKTAGVPHIDPDALSKIQQLQDNSVEVQSLFDQARSNPFQE